MYYSSSNHQTTIMLTTLFIILISLISLPCFTLSSQENQLRLPSNRKLRLDHPTYCESWRFSVETNDNTEIWITVPKKCNEFVEGYMTGVRYPCDAYFAAEGATMFARSINVSSDGMDAWVFDIDETLLSSIPYYQVHGFGAEVFNETSFNEWASLANAPPLPASLILYKELQQLGFTIFILTGRDEHHRNVTETNLLNAGYTHWKRLLLRGPSDKGIAAVEFKSGKRKELVDEGYRIRGNSGDQWSDLLGYATAERSFKLPNIMYYIA